MKKFIAIFTALLILVSIVVPVSISAYGKVTGVRQTNASSSSFEITWNEYQGADRYLIEWGLSPYDLSNTEHGYNSCSVYGRFPGKTYYVRVTPCVNYDDPVNSAASDVISVVTKPSEVKNIKQTKATTSSVTLKWDKSSGATSYDIYKYFRNGTNKKIGSTKSNSYTIKGLSNKNELPFSSIEVYPIKSSGSYRAVGYSTSIGIYNFNLTPAKAAAPKVTIFNSSKKNVWLDRTKTKYQDGYVYKIYKAKGKKAVKTITNNYQCNLKKGVFYKVKTRSYTRVNGKRYYGKWSKFTYFISGVKSLSSRGRSKHSVSLKWSKIKGGKVKYDIYVSKHSYKGLKLSKKNVKGTSAVISKIGKKTLKRHTLYYFCVRPKIKIGKKYIKSVVYSYTLEFTKR